MKMIDEKDKELARFGLMLLHGAGSTEELAARKLLYNAYRVYSDFSDKNQSSAHVYERLAQVFEGLGDQILADDMRITRDRITDEYYGENYTRDKDPLYQAERTLDLDFVDTRDK